jgi:hypothetical protein
VVSVTDPYCRILGFLDRSRYFFIYTRAERIVEEVVETCLETLWLLCRIKSDGSETPNVAQRKRCLAYSLHHPGNEMGNTTNLSVAGLQ